MSMEFTENALALKLRGLGAHPISLHKCNGGGRQK